MLPLTKALNEILELNEAFSRIGINRRKCVIALDGLDYAAKAHFAASVGLLKNKTVLLICADESEAVKCAADAAAFTGAPTACLPAREYNYYNIEGESRQWEHKRLEILHGLSKGGLRLVTCSIEAALINTMPPSALDKMCINLNEGMEISPEDLTLYLINGGYSRVQLVEGPGQFAVRGGIFDIFSPSAGLPVRIEFFGDEIDTISYIDPGSQRRTDRLKSLTVLPAAEIIPRCAPGGIEGLIRELSRLVKKTSNTRLAESIENDIDRLKNGLHFPSDRYINHIYKDPAVCIDYLPDDAVIIISDKGRVAERAKNIFWQYGEDIKSLLESALIAPNSAGYFIKYPDFFSRLERYDLVYLDTIASGVYEIPPRAVWHITAKQLSSYGGSLETALSDISHYLKNDYRVVVLASTKLRAENLYTMLTENEVKCRLDTALAELPPGGSASVCIGSLTAGIEYPKIKLAVITEGQIALPRGKSRIKHSRGPDRRRLQSFTDLSPGDLVVHEHHGIGRFSGVTAIQADGALKDYIKINFVGADCLYVPVTQLDLVSKYIGAGEETVKLSKLGGGEWARAKTRARAAVRDMARELTALYAKRQKVTGYAFPEDNEWQAEFEESFEYDETDDQLRCTEEIKRDMCSPRPMDRLLCGDVGFGKTEVALRAVVKCVLAGKQAAILAPTTVLAQQHFMTVQKRLSSFPVNIEMISRFRTPAQNKETVKRLANGAIDLVVGTHRLLQKDVQFKDLGILVVDEEQRFGVAHKEKIKERVTKVDVLTLSATPIPRTLNMALSGVRDMSTIEDPPRDRHPVQTYVLEHDWSVLADAMRREISRNGQVYYMHNRIESIDRIVSQISALLPGVTVGVGHGRMSERELSDVMRKTAGGEIQILVCTTIIESGIDIPNVNTLIIEDADRLGLAQLHQIRGRVGRGVRHAYAYLTFRRGKALSEIAAKRLSAVREFAEFGSGFKIAMRDLEIRGAGNILGGEQSGHMMSVGYDLYLKLLEEAVAEQSGNKEQTPRECSADLTVSAYIPEGFIPSSEQRMDLYRRIARIRSEEDASDMTDEICDRYGSMPQETARLIDIALLRAKASLRGIYEITQKKDQIKLSLHDVNLEKLSLLCTNPEYKRKLLLSAGNKPSISYKLSPGENPLEGAGRLIDNL